MKSITKILERNNLKPRERILTLIKNDANYEITGKSMLTKADIESLSNWNPRGGYEVDEYNRYWNMWDLFRKLLIDMHLLSNSTQLNIANFEKILIMYISIKDPNRIERLFGDEVSKQKNECIDIILEHSGLEYDEVAKKHDVKELQKMVDSGELIVKEIKEKVFDKEYTTQIITGRGLYNAKTDTPFAKEYIEQVNTCIPYAYLFYLLEKQNISEKYGHLLAFQEIVDNVSRIIETRATDFDQNFLNEMKNSIDYINMCLVIIENQMLNFIFTENDFDFHIWTFFSSHKIDLKKMEPVRTESQEMFYEDMKRFLGGV